MRYLVFTGDTYYPSGGWKDFKGGHDTIEEALTWLASEKHDWWQIVDLVTGQIERSGGRN